jgi:hypothetical protein
MEAITLIYKFVAITIRSDNGTNMPSGYIIEAIMFLIIVKALCDKAKHNVALSL